MIIPEHTNKQDLAFKNHPEVVSDDFLSDLCSGVAMVFKWGGGADIKKGHMWCMTCGGMLSVLIHAYASV